jgi:hypothetical protein
VLFLVYRFFHQLPPFIERRPAFIPLNKAGPARLA